MQNDQTYQSLQKSLNVYKQSAQNKYLRNQNSISSEVRGEVEKSQQMAQTPIISRNQAPTSSTKKVTGDHTASIRLQRTNASREEKSSGSTSDKKSAIPELSIPSLDDQ